MSVFSNKVLTVFFFTIIFAVSAYALPTVKITAPDSYASEPGSNTGTFTVSRTGSTNNALIVYYSISGTASNGTDYNNLSGSVTIPKDSNSSNITLTPIDDSVYEGTEDVTLTITANTAYNIGLRNSAKVLIYDNDVAPSLPVVTSSVVDKWASEALDANGDVNIAVFRINRTGSTSQPLKVYFNISGTATNGTDYNSISSPITIPAGSNFKDLTITPTDDSITEGTEEVYIAISADTNYTIGTPNNAEIFIYDNDVAPPTPQVVTISVIDKWASEALDANGDVNIAVFRINRTGSTSQPLKVYFNISGTATNGTDYNSLSSPVTIPAGSSFINLTVAPIDDLLVEGVEDINITISADANYIIGSPASAQVSITDND